MRRPRFRRTASSRASTFEYMEPIPQSPTRESLRDWDTGFPEAFCGSELDKSLWRLVDLVAHTWRRSKHVPPAPRSEAGPRCQPHRGRRQPGAGAYEIPDVVRGSTGAQQPVIDDA